jgi:hypothetical protein
VVGEGIHYARLQDRNRLRQTLAVELSTNSSARARVAFWRLTLKIALRSSATSLISVAVTLVVMDNLWVHKSKRVRELIERRGGQLVFLPSYSPDFNPKEESL